MADSSSTSGHVDESGLTGSPRVISPENISGILRFLFHIVNKTREEKYILAIVRLLTGARSNLADDDMLDGVGILAFFDVENVLSEGAALAFLSEFKIAGLEVTALGASGVKVIHRILVENNLSDQVPFCDLAFFLVSCRDQMAEGDLSDDVILDTIRSALLVPEEVRRIPVVWPASKDRSLASVMEWISHSIERLPPVVREWFWEAAASFEQEHDGIRQYLSPERLGLVHSHPTRVKEIAALIGAMGASFAVYKAANDEEGIRCFADLSQRYADQVAAEQRDKRRGTV